MRIPGLTVDFEQLPGALPVFRSAVSADEWLTVPMTLIKGGGRLLSVWGTDRGGGQFAVCAAYAAREGLVWLDLPLGARTTYPDLTPLFPFANRMQRALFDLLGLRAEDVDGIVRFVEELRALRGVEPHELELGGRIVVTVDEDVDPSNLADVMWAITTRCEPSEQVDIVKSAWSSGLDPRITPEARARGETSHSKLIIDACKPFGWRERYPRTSALTSEEARAIREKWFR